MIRLTPGAHRVRMRWPDPAAGGYIRNTMRATATITTMRTTPLPGVTGVEPEGIVRAVAAPGDTAPAA